MHVDPRLPRLLHVDPVFPGNGLPPRPGEDRPGLSPFGRLAKGQTLGKSSILIYDRRRVGVQQANVDMIVVEGDDLDAQQLILTLHPPRVIPLPFDDVSARLDQQNLTGEQTNAEVSSGNFPGTDDAIRWPPLEALIEFGTGGVNTQVVVDYVNGATLSVPASYLRVSALVAQDCAPATSAAYYLAAHVAPGYAKAHAQRTILAGVVDDGDDSCAFDLPKLARIATLVGCRPGHHSPTPTVGWIRFWQSPNGTNPVGDVLVSDPHSRVKIPNGAQYFSILNQSGHKMKMSVIFELAL